MSVNKSSNHHKASGQPRNVIIKRAIEAAKAPASSGKKRINTILASYIISFFTTCLATAQLQAGNKTGYIFFIAALITLGSTYFVGRKNIANEEYVIFTKILIVITIIALFLGVCALYYLLGYFAFCVDGSQE